MIFRADAVRFLLADLRQSQCLLSQRRVASVNLGFAFS